MPLQSRSVKVLGRKEKSKKILISIRLDEGINQELKKLVNQTGVPRQRIIEGILKKALNDPHFVLDTKEL